MKSIKETNLFSEIIKELNYPFGDIFIFDGFVVSEINRGVTFSWENHGKIITEDVSCYLGTYGNDLIYISHRINSYSVLATDWLEFFKNSYSLNGYYIVSESYIGVLNSMIENLFFNNKIKRFNTIQTAVNWVRLGFVESA